jgi:hypothetical protein
VHAEQVGEDGCGQVGCEGGECSVAGGPDADSVPVQPGGQGVAGDRLPGDAAGEQPTGSSPVVGDHQVFLRLGGQTLQEASEAGRQQDRVPSSGEVGVLVFRRDLVSGQVPDAFAGQSEQQG